MMIKHPDPEQLTDLLQMWKSVFGEHGGFWELFLDTAFEADHCRCITLDGQAAAALYWFDCLCSGQKMAYIYAVVTHPEHRNKGLCQILLEDVHAHLRKNGYAAAMLVPEKEGLRQMYRKLGYTDCTSVSKFSCACRTSPVTLCAITPEAYRQLRRKFLPEGGVVQEGKNLDFLAAQAQLYTGEDFLLAAYADEGELFGMELLGDRTAAPGILKALGFEKGSFRIPGTEKNFAMYHPLTEDAAIPTYFGFAFD